MKHGENLQIKSTDTANNSSFQIKHRGFHNTGGSQCAPVAGDENGTRCLAMVPSHRRVCHRVTDFTTFTDRDGRRRRSHVNTRELESWRRAMSGHGVSSM